jgi:hypothetical protein
MASLPNNENLNHNKKVTQVIGFSNLDKKKSKHSSKTIEFFYIPKCF